MGARLPQLARNSHEFGKAYAARGFLWIEKGEFEASVADFSAAIERGDCRAGVLLGRAEAFYCLAKYAEAIADCTSVIAIDPNHAGAYNYRGLVRVIIGERDGALADFDRAIELAPAWWVPYMYRAQLAAVRSNWEAAIADYTQFISKIETSGQKEEASTLAIAYWNRSQAHRSRGENALAKADRREAISRDPALKER